ncbi:hypothetical protein QEG98_42030 (plasmid) [Myxococcus sp. MxC21-1]|uniref:hypothetical protein n=1 Tax=Myxococcus sp. MxC21-1 TaxID=3041439 RepID=UPI002931370C|nr:hypothetical protein [Myxococcus sp. MxC21-1]WNZ66200.1 hypothetical protein QEG98_42030 [Myxococcus sp. MxC21-1]
MPNDEEVRTELARSPTMNSKAAQRLALGVSIDSGGAVFEWGEEAAQEYVAALLRQPFILAFNGLRFDNVVLSRYVNDATARRLHLNTLDLMFWLQWRLGEAKPRSLNTYAAMLLRKKKLELNKFCGPHESIPALWRRGRPEDLVALRIYCWLDADLLRDLWSATHGSAMERRAFYAWWLEDQASRVRRALAATPPATAPSLAFAVPA